MPQQTSLPALIQRMSSDFALLTRLIQQGRTQPTAAPRTPRRRPYQRDKINTLLLRREGTSLAEALRATGWRKISFNAQAEALGLDLVKRKVRENGRLITRYWGVQRPTPMPQH